MRRTPSRRRTAARPQSLCLRRTMCRRPLRSLSPVKSLRRKRGSRPPEKKRIRSRERSASALRSRHSRYGREIDNRGGYNGNPRRQNSKRGRYQKVSSSFVITHGFCCSHPRISQGRGSVRGKPLRVSPLAFNHPPAGDRFCAAKSPHQKNTTTQRVVIFFWCLVGNLPRKGV